MRDFAKLSETLQLSYLIESLVYLLFLSGLVFSVIRPDTETFFLGNLVVFLGNHFSVPVVH